MIRTTLASLAFATAALSGACMGIGRDGGFVRFAGQKNIIVWDKAHGMEHFVRDARFQTGGDSLGFIAPTPNRPKIEAVNGKAFDLLESLNPAPIQVRGGFGGGSFGAPGGKEDVTVLETKMVAGYEATVLKATDSVALTQWLRGNGYAVPRFATKWVAPYVAKDWYFTAFKVAADGKAGSTGPVRMSFKTDTPYNPYSVPEENGGQTGLSLYYVTAGQEEASIGGTQAWFHPQWVAPLDEDAAQILAVDLKIGFDSVPKNSKVRFYRDNTFGRPGMDDIFFVSHAKPLRSPFDGLLAGLGLGVFAFVRTGRKSG